MNKSRKTIIGVVVLLLVLLICGCGSKASSESQPTEDTVTQSNTETTSPTIRGEKGGYVLTVNQNTITVLVEDTYKQVQYVSADGSNTIDFYASPTEMTVVDTTNGVKRYYTEKLDATNQIYENPITQICGKFAELEFKAAADNENLLVATQAYQVETTQAVAYRCYDICMTWTDNKEYQFQYFEFADGNVMVSAYAPDEINPYFTEDCKWKFDIENLILYHEETNQTVAIVVQGMTEGESSAMVDEEDRTYTTQTATVYIELGETESPVSLRYENQGTTFSYQFLYDFTIEPPVYEKDWSVMSSEEAQKVLMLISMLENLI